MRRLLCQTQAAVAASTVLFVLASTIEAQPLLEEITVTAQRREQNLQDVPIAISAVTAQAIEDRGLTNVAQISDFTPNVQMDGTSPFSGSSSVLSPYVRGIGQNDFAFNLEPGVGVYVDGVYLARTIGANVDLLDIDRIEVLKGPQGTLFGRNTIGGALNITTRRPADEFSYRGELTVGDFSRTDFRFSVDVPSDNGNVLSSIALSMKNRDGYQERIPFPGAAGFVFDQFDDFLVADRTTHGESGGEDADNLRAKVLWAVNDNVEVTFAADYSSVDEEGVPNTLLALDINAAPADPFDGLIDGTLAGLYDTCVLLPPAVLAGIPPLANICLSPRAVIGTPMAGAQGPYMPYGPWFFISDSFTSTVNPDTGNPEAFTAVGVDIDKTYAEGNNYSIIDNFGFSLTFDIELGGATLKSITAIRDLDALFGQDQDGSPLQIIDPSFDTHQEQISQEIQIGGTAADDRLSWLAGLYYFQEDGDLTDFVTFPGGLLQIFGENFFDNDAWAAFTHLNFALTDRWSLTLGARYTDEHKEFDGRQRDLNQLLIKLLVTPPTSPPYPDPNDVTRFYPLGVNVKDFTDTSVRAGAEYRFADNVMGYVSYSEGFKSGGWTTRLSFPHITIEANPPQNPDRLDFDPETATSYEIGVKSELLDRRVMLNTALFTTDYENIQVLVQQGISPVFANAGDGDISGLEVELTGVLTDRFSLTGSLGYLDAEYTRLDPGIVPLSVLNPETLDLNDKFINTPDLSYSLGGEYRFPLQAGGDLSVRLDYIYKDEIANDIMNNALLVQDEIDLVNLALSYTPAGGNWSLSFGGRNLTDERYIMSGFRNDGGGVTSANYSRPKEWFAAFRFNNN
ncbi:MAG TPA: TonB-dependent receptor [Gammaproteobacteria bacterium]